MKRELVGVLLVVTSVLAGCKTSGGAEAAPAKEAAGSGGTGGDPLSVTVLPKLLETLKLGRVSQADVAANLTVAARLEVDETRVTRLGSPVTARVAALSVLEGQFVRKGQVMAALHSTDLAAAQFGYLKALSQRQLAERGLARAKQLLAAEVIGLAELQRRESELAQAEAEVDSFRDQLTVLGVGQEALTTLAATRKVSSVISVAASMDGVVLKRLVAVGQVVQPADPVFVVADLTNLWLVADVPEMAVPGLRVGMQVKAEITAFPEKPVVGRLSFISPTVEPEVRTVHVRMDVPNPAGVLKPAMIATMHLKDRPKREVVLPSTAIVRESGREYVFVQTGTDKFLLREVVLQPESGGVQVLISGVRPEEVVVLDGAFHLNNERKKASMHE